MHDLRQQRGLHAVEAAEPGLRDEAAPPRRRLRCIGRRLGVHQRQPLDPLRRPPQDLEADIAAHREAAEREALGCRVEGRLRHGADRLVVPQLGHDRVGQVGEVCDLAFEQAARVEQARQQDERGHQIWI